MVARIQNENFFDYDVVIATPDMMGLVGRLGKVLGPKGLMPNPKAGTVSMDVARAVTGSQAGNAGYRGEGPALCISLPTLSRWHFENSDNGQVHGRSEIN